MDGTSKTELSTHILNLRYDLGGYDLRYIGSTTDADDDIGAGDADFTGLFLAVQVGNTEYKTDSHELRITSPGGETIDWMAGLYYEKGDNHRTQANVFGFRPAAIPAPPGITFPNLSTYDEDQKYKSAFAALTWNITDAWALDVGGRYTDVEKSATACAFALSANRALAGANSLTVLSGCSVPGFDISTGGYQDSELDYSVSLRWAATDNV